MNKNKIELIIYKRVSTKEQRNSGLGLKAQERDINFKIRELHKYYEKVVIIGEFSEIASGKNIKNREKLQQAIKLCKNNNYYLLVQKVDRLSRDLLDGITIFNNLEKRIFFSNWDNINETELQFRLIFSQQERKQISIRTKKALNELKKQGVKLGRKWKRDEHGNIIKGQNQKQINLMLKTRQTKSTKYYQKVMNLINDLTKQKDNLSTITKKVNKYGFKTIRGKEFKLTTIKRLLDKEQANL